MTRRKTAASVEIRVDAHLVDAADLNDGVQVVHESWSKAWRSRASVWDPVDPNSAFAETQKHYFVSYGTLTTERWAFR
jgi:hypothetical protein